MKRDDIHNKTDQQAIAAIKRGVATDASLADKASTNKKVLAKWIEFLVRNQDRATMRSYVREKTGIDIRSQVQHVYQVVNVLQTMDATAITEAEFDAAPLMALVKLNPFIGTNLQPQAMESFRCASPRKALESLAKLKHCQPASLTFKHGQWHACTAKEMMPTEPANEPAEELVKHPVNEPAKQHASKNAGKRPTNEPVTGPASFDAFNGVMWQSLIAAVASMDADDCECLQELLLTVQATLDDRQGSLALQNQKAA